MRLAASAMRPALTSTPSQQHWQRWKTWPGVARQIRQHDSGSYAHDGQNVFPQDHADDISLRRAMDFNIPISRVRSTGSNT